MIKLEVLNKNNDEYEFKDDKENNYILNLEILDIREKIKERRLNLYIGKITKSKI